MDFKIYDYESIDSTNNEAKRLYKEKMLPFIVSSKHQSEGRGTFGKSFYSPKDKGLYMTLAIKRNISIKRLQDMNIALGTVISKNLNYKYDIETHPKKPNDIMFEDKKLSGILTEGILSETDYDVIFIGVGMNLFKDDALPLDLKNLVISLSECTDIPILFEDIVSLVSQSILEVLNHED